MYFHVDKKGLILTAMRSLQVVPNLGTWDPYLPKMEEALKIYATG